MNTFNRHFRVSTFGESHGVGIGCVIDGLPAGLFIDEDFIKNELVLRAGGRNIFTTPRKEKDEFEILSGVFEGVSTGAPICLLIRNKNIKSKDYSTIKELFRPSHADFTYFHKYGVRDYRGGGRSSARESVARVMAGALAKLLLKEFDIIVGGGIIGVGEAISMREDFSPKECKEALDSEIFALDKGIEEEQKKLIARARESEDSIGASALVKAFNMPIGLGAPLYGKLDSKIGEFMLGLNGVKGVEIGKGAMSARMCGSAYNDQMDAQGFITNHSGGMLGGISNGDDLVIKVHFKPTPSIGISQSTQNIYGQVIPCSIKGRHDPCIGIRGAIIAQSQLAIILADALLENTNSKLENIKKIYL